MCGQLIFETSSNDCRIESGGASGNHEDEPRRVSQHELSSGCGVYRRRAAGEERGRTRAFPDGKGHPAILPWFERFETSWQLEALPDVRVQVSAENYRVPDICLRPLANPDLRFVTTVPAAVIEVLSPEDSVSDCRERIADYLQKGIPGIWIMDPKTRKGWDCSSGNWIESVVFRMPDSPVYLDLGKIAVSSQ
jgi:Putative restriction endonuclease